MLKNFIERYCSVCGEKRLHKLMVYGVERFYQCIFCECESIPAEDAR